MMTTESVTGNRRLTMAIHWTNCPECPYYDGSTCIHDSGGFTGDCPWHVDEIRNNALVKHLQARAYAYPVRRPYGGLTLESWNEYNQ